MGHLTYLAVLAFIAAGSLWLEYAVRTKVLRRPLRLFASVLPVWVLFVAWDRYAVGAGHWTFDDEFITGIRVGAVPLEELLFFVVVPVAAVLTFEAVRAVKGWPVGDVPEGMSR
jgi:lycopene cyclase domain-containing protein